MSRDKMPWQIRLPGDPPRTPPRSPPRTPPRTPPKANKLPSEQKQSSTTATTSSGEESVDELMTPRVKDPVTPVKSRDDAAIDELLTPSMAALKTPSKASKPDVKKRAIEGNSSEDELLSDHDADKGKEAWRSLFKPAGSGATTTSQTASSKKGQAASSKKGQASSKKVKSGSLASFFGTASSPSVASSASLSSAPAAQKRSDVTPTIAPASSPADAGPSASSSASSSFVPLTSSSPSAQATSSSSALPPLAGPSALPALAGPSMLPSLAGPSALPDLAGPSTASTSGRRPTPRMDPKHADKLAKEGKAVERTIEYTPRMLDAHVQSIKAQHPGMTFGFKALKDIPLLVNPLEPNLYLWNVAAKFTQLGANAALLQRYQRMLARLQLVRIAAGSESVDTWLDRFALWLGPRTCQFIWHALASSADDKKTLHDGDIDDKLKLFRRIFEGLDAARTVERFKSDYPQHKLHASVWQIVEAASAYATGTGPALRSAAVFPPTLFPNQLHLTAHPIDTDACEDDVEANKPALFAACREYGTSGILGAYRVIQLTHVLNTLLLDDARKPGWTQLHALTDQARAEAVLACANLPEDHPWISKEDIFSPAQLEAFKAASRARTEQIAQGSLRSKPINALQHSPRRALLLQCREAAERDGHQKNSPAYHAKAGELFKHYRPVTKSECDCEYCQHSPLTLTKLTAQGAAQRKADGARGRVNIVTNFSIDRANPARLGGKYDVRFNTRRSCKGCNYTKSGFPEENFLVLLGDIKLHALTELDANRMLSPSPPPFRDVTRAEDDFIKGWVSSRVTSLQSGHKGTRKEGDLNFKQLYGEVRKWYAGDGCVIDGASGLKLPLHLMHIDRKNPGDPYTLQTIRLLFGPFNCNRNDAPDDQPLADHFKNVRNSFDIRRSLALRAKGFGLPGMRTAARLARGQCSLDDEEVRAEQEAAEEAREELARLEAAASAGGESEDEEE